MKTRHDGLSIEDACNILKAEMEALKRHTARPRKKRKANGCPPLKIRI